MASENEPPDKRAGKTFKCHKNQKVNWVICLVCEDTYHSSDFNRLKETKYVNETFALCSKHPNLTSLIEGNVLDSVSVRALITEIKMFERNRVREEVRAEMQKELDNSLASVSYNSNRDLSAAHNNTIRDEDEPDVRLIKTENILLRERNEELKQQNGILLDSIELLKANKPSYTDALKSEAQKQILRIPDIEVKSKKPDQKNCNEGYELVSQNIQSYILVPINKVIQTKSGTTIVKCVHFNDVISTKDILQNKLGLEYEVTLQEFKKPRLKVTGIECSLTADELQNDINERNFFSCSSKCSIVHTFPTPKDTIGVILEVTGELYELIVKNKNRIYVGHQSYKAYDDFNIRPCSNCGRYGHSGNKCKNESSCISCAGKHKVIDCPNNGPFKCVNCDYANKKYNLEKDVSHMACDTLSCDILKKKINLIIETTDYPTKPVIPQYLGMVKKIDKQERNVNTDRRAHYQQSAADNYRREDNYRSEDNFVGSNYNRSDKHWGGNNSNHAAKRGQPHTRTLRPGQRLWRSTRGRRPYS